jgi:protein-tyrosine phosphatase
MNKRVLFVCLGNICRSPAAEAVLKHWAAQRTPQTELEVDSAGTIGAHLGERPDPRMRAAGEARGYTFTSLARRVTTADLENGRFDLVVAMDRQNLADLKRMAPVTSGNIVLMSEFLDSQWPRDVPDPYYGVSQGFEAVLDMIEAACPAIFKRLTSSQPER